MGGLEQSRSFKGRRRTRPRAPKSTPRCAWDSPRAPLGAFRAAVHRHSLSDARSQRFSDLQVLRKPQFLLRFPPMSVGLLLSACACENNSKIPAFRPPKSVPGATKTPEIELGRPSASAKSHKNTRSVSEILKMRPNERVRARTDRMLERFGRQRLRSARAPLWEFPIGHIYPKSEQV